MSGSVRGGAAGGCGREKKCRVWRARFCPSRAQAILGLSARDAKEMPCHLVEKYSGRASRELIGFFEKYCQTVFDRYQDKVEF